MIKMVELRRIFLAVLVLFFSAQLMAEIQPKSLTEKQPSTVAEKAGKTDSSAHQKGEAKKTPSSSTVKINSASAEEISAALTGIGPAKAQAIVEFRGKNGKFAKLEDLKAVKGIGDATLEKNKERIIID